jgi:hypothetical protein
VDYLAEGFEIVSVNQVQSPNFSVSYFLQKGAVLVMCVDVVFEGTTNAVTICSVRVR